MNGFTRGALALAGLLAVATAQAQAPTFTNYVAPGNLGNSAGEPSIGVNPATGAVMYIASTSTLKVEFNAQGAAQWQDVTGPLTGLATLDPILFTDQSTGRTFASQLLAATSAMEYTDDDGASWTPSTLGVTPGVDHQTIGGGPYPAGTFGAFATIARAFSYPNAVYYCGQGIVAAFCLRSDNGGLTFGPPVPAYTMADCGGLHGHLKVAGDGTVYLPNKSCGSGEPAVVVSDNAGVTWSVRTIPGATSSGQDPSVAIDKDGTIYVAYVEANGHPHVAVSHDKGQSWASNTDVGSALGLATAVFPVSVAGDSGRAAVGFIATSTPGDSEVASFNGLWYGYIASTFDGGSSWTTTDVTPGDPVQGAGGICTSGTTCGSNRNLLDFNDMTVDAEGRVLMGYADGCVGSCVTGGANTFAAKATIARQVSGTRLFAAFD